MSDGEMLRGSSTLYFFRRNTGVLKRNVSRAIEALRKTPDSNSTSLKTEENEPLIDGLKRLFDSSDYDDQVRLLTLSSSN